MSTAIEAAFSEWYNKAILDNGECPMRQCFYAGVDFAAKANTELIKEYQETMEKKSEE